MSTTVEIVDVEDLRSRRGRLLAEVGMSWEDLQQGADDYTLTDEQRSIYDTIEGIDWLLAADE